MLLVRVRVRVMTIFIIIKCRQINVYFEEKKNGY